MKTVAEIKTLEVEKTIDLEQAAKILGIHPETCRRLTLKGDIPAIRLGQRPMLR